MSLRVFAVGVFAAFAVTASLVTGCESSCSSTETRTEVRGGDGSEYVCIPNPRNDDDNEGDRSYPPSTAIAPTAKTPSPPPPPSSSPAPVSTCAALVPTAKDIDVVPKPGAPATFLDAAPPNGRYELVQASSYGSLEAGSGAAPVQTIRASLEVMGAKLVVGTQATTGTTLEANESFTLTLASGVVTKVCESRRGAIAYGLFHGAAGSTHAAHLGWSGSTSILTLVMTTPTGQAELLFMPP